MRRFLTALCLLVATSAWGQSSETYILHRGAEMEATPDHQIDCTNSGTDLLSADNTDGTGDYDRLSISMWNCDPVSGGVDVMVCLGDATCGTTQGFVLTPQGRAVTIDWATYGPIGCVTGSGTATVCVIEEKR
jgi:hypothetical protein